MSNLFQNPQFKRLLGDLHAHAALTNAGISSNQASEIVFHRLRTEDVHEEMNMRSSVSDCCRAIVLFEEGMNAYCTACGDYCSVVPNDN